MPSAGSRRSGTTCVALPSGRRDTQHPLRARGDSGARGRRALVHRDVRGRLHGAERRLRRRPAERSGDAAPAGHRALPRNGLPLGALGPRARPGRRAGRRDRHRCLGDPVRPGDPAAGGELHVFQRTAPWVMPPPQPPDQRAGEAAVPPVARAASPCARLRLRSASAGARVHVPAPDASSREGRAAAPRAAGPRSGAPRAASPAVHDRLQADPVQRRLVPGARAAQRRARHRCDRRGPGALDRHRRRRGAGDRHDHLWHRLPRDGHAVRRARPGPRRPHAGRDLERKPEGLQRNRDPGVPELLHAARPEYRARSHVGPLHGRVAARLRRGRTEALSRSGAATLDVRSSALAEWVREMDGSLASTVWNAGGCRSWYLDRTGRNATIWPGPTFRFRRRLRTFDPAPYELGAAQPASELASA